MGWVSFQRFQVFSQLPWAVAALNPFIAQQVVKSPPAQPGQFTGFAKAENPFGIEPDGQFLFYPTRNLISRQAHCLGYFFWKFD
jgi:hypothetical protein